MDVTVQNTITIGVTAAIMYVLTSISDARKITAAAAAKKKEKEEYAETKRAEREEDKARQDQVAKTVADAAKQATEANAKADTIVVKTDEIKVLTDGNLSKTTARLDVALQKISGLETLVASLLERDKIELAKQAMPPNHTPALPDPTNGESGSRASEVRADHQVDRIEQTGEQIHTRVQKIEKNTEIRDEQIEAKLDKKEDK